MSKETNHHDGKEEHREPNAVDGITAHEPAHERKRGLPATVLGHEGFVQPSSYLRRPRGLSRPMNPAKLPETAVDREQRRGLVNATTTVFSFVQDGANAWFLYLCSKESEPF
jgi:hypothetical protein